MNPRLISRPIAACAAVLALIAAACEGARPSTGSGTAGDVTENTHLSVSLSEFSITPAELTAPAGRPISVAVTNAGKVPHTFAVDAGGTTVETALMQAGGTAALELPALDAGSYAAWCTVAGHGEA